MDKKTILFVSYGGGHVHMLAPLILEAQKDQRLEPRTIGLTIAQKIYRNQYGIECEGAKEYITKDDTDARRFGLQLLQKMQANGNYVDDIEETVAYLGTSFADLVQTEGSEKKAWESYRSNGRAAFLPLTFMRRAFDRIQPDLLVTTNSPRGEKAAQTVARERGIRSILLTDLFNCPPEYNFFADRICVLSESAKKNLLEWNGTDESKIVITGNPAFDESIEKAGLVDYEWREKHLGCGRDEKLFLWADQPGRFDWNSLQLIARTETELIDTLNELLISSRRENLKLMIRSHPSQDVQLYRDWCSKHDVPLVNEPEINKLINAVDVLGSSSSTVLLQAYFIGRIVFQLSLGGGKKVINIENWKNVFVADEVDNIPSAMAMAAKAMLKRSYCSSIEKSTPKVMKLILQTLDDMN